MGVGLGVLDAHPPNYGMLMMGNNVVQPLP